MLSISIRPERHSYGIIRETGEILGVSVDGRYMDEKNVFHINNAGLVAYSHGEYLKLGKSLGKFGFSVKKNK